MRNHPTLTHDDVNEQVQGDNDPLNGSSTVKLVVTQDGCSGMVEDVEECQLLLLKNEEDGVEELDVLDVVVDHVVRDESGSECLGVADGPEETIVPVEREAVWFGNERL